MSRGSVEIGVAESQWRIEKITAEEFEGRVARDPRPNFAQSPHGARLRELSGWSTSLLGLVSVVAVVVGLSVDEDGANQWDRVNAWGGLAIAAALLTLAPLIGRSIGWTAERARQVAGVGAGALVLFWVLFTLPEVGSNTSLVTTVGVAAGAAAVALARP